MPQTGAQNWTEAVNGFVNASSAFQKNNVLHEMTCKHDTGCDSGYTVSKGTATRSFARTALFAPFVTDSITTMLKASAKAAARACDGTDDVRCSFTWAEKDSEGESASASEGNVGEVFNALEVVQGLLYPSAKGLKNVNGTAPGNENKEDSSQNENASGTDGANAPENTGAAGKVAASVTVALAVVFAAALSC
jgi:mannan endo-1,6-alpha-mannosidase